MTRRCSHCNHNGHNSRTCPGRGGGRGGSGVRLFGVRITEGSSLIRKSASMSCLSHLSGGSSGGSASPAGGPDLAGGGVTGGADGYASDDMLRGSTSSGRERKKGLPWTEEEHRMFLLGLQKLGKGDWRGISRSFVITRTPTQVASHAQKYFIRQTNINKRKRRSSLFDMVPDEPIEALSLPTVVQGNGADDDQVEPCPPVDELCESMDSSSSVNVDLPVAKCILNSDSSPVQYNLPVVLSTVYSPFMPLTLPLWPSIPADTLEPEAYEIVKPTAIHTRAPIHIDNLIGLSKLSIAEANGGSFSLASSTSLVNPNRRSAFHSNSSARSET